MDGVSLPLLFEHGPWIWKVVLVAFVATIVGGLALLRRRVARRAARDALAGVDRDGVVRGTLKGGEGDVLATLEASLHELADPPRDNPNRQVSTTWIADGVYLDTEQGRVVLDGPAVVLAGTQVTAKRRGVPAGIRDEHLAAAREQAPWIDRIAPRLGLAVLRRLRAGDAVVATGVLEPVPSQDAAGYRDAPPQWVLRPVADATIRIAARAPARDVRPVSVIAMLFVAAAATGIGYFTLSKLGKRWLEACDDAPVTELSNTHACALAAATPKHQDDAYEELLWNLDRSAGVASARNNALALALAERVENCKSIIGRLSRQQRYADAAARARRCGDKRAEHVALMHDARFAEAAALHVPAEEGLAELPTVPTLIAAGKWSDAAARIDRIVEATASKPREDDDARPHVLAHWSCFAELLRHHAGDKGAITRMRSNAAAAGGDACIPMLAEVVEPTERAQLLSTDAARLTLLDTTKLVATLAWIEGLQPLKYAHTSPAEMLVKPHDLGASRETPTMWLAELASARRRETGAALTADVLRWLAVKRAFEGKPDDARELARQARAVSTPRSDRYEDRDTPHLLPAIALHTGATDVPVDFGKPPEIDEELARIVHENWLHDFGRLLLRAGKPIDAAYFGPRDSYKAALVAAQAGDARSLVREIGGASSWWSVGDVVAVWPRVTTGRAELLEAVTHAPPSWSSAPSIDYNYPFGLLGDVVERRTLARLAGTDSQRWDERYQRLDAVFSDRAKLVALVIWRD